MRRHKANLPDGEKIEFDFRHMPAWAVDELEKTVGGVDFKSVQDAVNAMQNALQTPRMRAVISREMRDTLNAMQARAVHSATAQPAKASSSSLPPPKVVEGFFWLLLPRKHREGILGDAEEAYWQTIDRYGSRRIATVDYCKEAAFAILFATRVGVSSLLSGAALKLREIFKQSSS